MPKKDQLIKMIPEEAVWKACGSRSERNIYRSTTLVVVIVKLI
jgi:hypothetical protein